MSQHFTTASVEALFADRKLTSTAKLLRFYLAERWTREIRVSVPALAVALGMGERTLFRARDELFDAGWLDWSISGRGPSDYRLMVPEA